MSKTAILKLGGSIITQKKSGKPVLKEAFVKKAAKELSLALKRKPGPKLILLHGAGSFGHPLVYKYRLKNQKLKIASFNHIGQVVRQLRDLGNELTKIFIAQGLPLVPLQTSSLFIRNKGKTILKNFSVIETILKGGGIPLLGGDLTLGGDRVYVLSADEISVLLAKRIKNSQLFFATDVEGVYKSFPPLKGEKAIELLQGQELKLFLEKNTALTTLGKHDVSGDVLGKLKQLTFLKNNKAFIFNGQKPHLISKALKGEKVKGTTIFL